MKKSIHCAVLVAALGAGIAPAMAQYTNGDPGYPGGWRSGAMQQVAPGLYRSDLQSSMEMCTKAASMEAAQYGKVRLGAIKRQTAVRDGFEIEGRISVSYAPSGKNGHHYHDGDKAYGGGQHYGHSSNYNGLYVYNNYEDDWVRPRDLHNGHYTCEVRQGKIVKLELRGVK